MKLARIITTVTSVLSGLTMTIITAIILAQYFTTGIVHSEILQPLFIIAACCPLAVLTIMAVALEIKEFLGKRHLRHNRNTKMEPHQKAA